MIRTLFAGLRIWIFMLIYYFKYNIQKIFWSSSKRQKIMIKYMHEYFHFVMKVTLTNLIVEGTEHISAIPKDRAITFVSNHESYLDIPSVMGSTDFSFGFIAKKELSRIPILNFWVKTAGGIFLDRKNLKASLRKIKEISKDPSKRMLFLFPEGTRNKENTVGVFKPASLRFAFANNSMIIPVTICGGRQKFEGNSYKITKGDVYVRFHQATDSTTIDKTNKNKFVKELNEVVLNSHNEFKKILNKK